MCEEPGRCAPAEKTAASRDSRLEAILNTIVDGIITINERGLIQSFNPAAEKIFGYRADEVIGRNVNMLMPEPYHSHHDRYIANYLATGEKRIIGIGREVVGKRRDGSLFPMDLAVSEARVDGRRIFAGIIRDISERRRAEQEREELIRELEEKNAELERFTYTVSHDLRGPLTPIMGYAEFIRENYRQGLDGAAVEMLEEIERQGERMLDLMEDLLALARAGYLERPAEPIPLEDVIREVLGFLTDQVSSSGLEVRTQSSLDLRFPRTLLVQILSNLVGNALRYSGHKGGPIEIGGERQEKKARLFVRDHGPGIPPEERRKVFDLFYRGASAGTAPGTGVGLATVRKIARAYSGSAWVDETPGGGSTFWVEFEDG